MNGKKLELVSFIIKQMENTTAVFILLLYRLNSSIKLILEIN